MNLIADNEVIENLMSHAESDYPNECCGFLFGHDGKARHFTLSKRAVNRSEGDRRRRFQIDPNEYRKAEQFALDNDLDLLGVYHSHPDHPAEPSEHDLAVAMPYFSYIIVSVQNGSTDDIRSWRLIDVRRFEEETFLKQTIETNP